MVGTYILGLLLTKDFHRAAMADCLDRVDFVGEIIPESPPRQQAMGHSGRIAAAGQVIDNTQHGMLGLRQE
jgi:hypothetical protein